jgi:hypothetical protein
VEPLREISYVCPFCWETIETTVTMTELPLETVEDCRVCCHPALIRVTLGPDGEAVLEAEPAA